MALPGLLTDSQTHSMPHLIESEHPTCALLIREYLSCTKDTPFLTYIAQGGCTGLKYELDRCFKAEKRVNVVAGIAKAKVLSIPASLRAVTG